ncbi:MAG TPA: hypothetical protein DEQ61_25715 [Streptomyces sp.]|nr:hypothetical protein [Streptomyces sp.]
MKFIVAGQSAVTASEFVELALGIDFELFTGTPGENDMERAARLDAARDILTDLHQSDPEAAAYAEALMRTVPLPLRSKTAAGRRGAVAA